MKRTSLVLLALTIVASLLLACAPPAAPAAPAAGGEAAPTEAGKVTLNVWASPDNGDALNEIARTFMEKNPNIEVVVTVISWEQLYAKMLSDVAAKTGAYDVATWDVMTAGALANGLEDLAQFKKDHPDLVDPNWDENDFDPTVWHVSGIWAGKNIGIPFYNNTMLFYYRKDLFNDPNLQAAFKEKYGRDLEVPKTWDETVEVAEFFTKSANPDSPTDYGIALMFPRTHTTFYMYLLWFAGYRRSEEGLAKFGELDLDYGDYFTADHKPAFASEEGLKAMQDIAKLLPFSPDPLGSDYGETLEAFSKGTVAMVPQWTNPWATWKTVEALQPFEEKVGAAVMPGGHSVGGSWALGINVNSKHKAEAFKFIQYATNKDNDKMKFIKFGAAPARISTLEDPEVLAADPRVPALKETYPEQAYRPRIPEEPKLEDITISTFTGMLLGEQPMTVETLQTLADQWNRILGQ
ncbi:MAG: sugar ABC transporter substrate-binding protein [Anaerolineae bacterium]